MENKSFVSRRVSADFVGDEALDLDVLEVRLRISQHAKSKSDKDSLLVKTAIAALQERVDAFCLETGTKYPDCENFIHWLHSQTKGEKEPQTVRRSLPSQGNYRVPEEEFYKGTGGLPREHGVPDGEPQKD